MNTMRRRKEHIKQQQQGPGAGAGGALSQLVVDFGENSSNNEQAASAQAHYYSDDDHVDDDDFDDADMCTTANFLATTSERLQQHHPTPMRRRRHHCYGSIITFLAARRRIFVLQWLGVAAVWRRLLVLVLLLFFIVVPLMIVMFSKSSSSALLIQSLFSLFTSCQLQMSSSTVYASLEEANFREFRFPSVQERLEIYLGNWYTPACSCSSSSSSISSNMDNGDFLDRRIHFFKEEMQQQKQQQDGNNNIHHTNATTETFYYVVQEELDANDDQQQTSEQQQRWFAIDTWIQPARIFFVTRQNIQDCSCYIDEKQPNIGTTTDNKAAAAASPSLLSSSSCTASKLLLFYCRDVHETILPAMDALFALDEESLSSSSFTARTTTKNDNAVVVVQVRPPILIQFGDTSESLAPPANKEAIQQAALLASSGGGGNISASSSRIAVTGNNNGSALLMSQPHLPHLKKFRLAMNRSELKRVASPPPTATTTASSTSTTLLLPSSSCCATDQNNNNNCNSSSSTACCSCCCWNGPRPIPQTMRGSRLQPIIWKLNTKRHYHNLHQVPCLDISWDKKRNQGVFRGTLTGAAPWNVNINANNNNNNSFVVLSNEAKCLLLPRCAMVLKHLNSTWVDARLTDTFGKVPDVIVPETVDKGEQQQKQHPGWNLTVPKPLSLREMLRYKAIIILEGNDVSTGLKWALLSNSVVLMPPPTMTSWLMEEWLEAWVHYVPLLPDLTNVETQVQWVVQHSAEAQRIAHRGALWIKDLVFHPTAIQDDEFIFREMLRRYQQHFVHSPPIA